MDRATGELPRRNAWRQPFWTKRERNVPRSMTDYGKQNYFGVGCPKSEWIKPDAMALLYAPARIS